MDNYAETTISTKGAVLILQEAKKFKKPKDMYMTLRQLQEQLAKQGKDGKTLRLLG